MGNSSSRLWLGLGLIAIGVLSLLDEFDYLHLEAQLVFAFIFAAIGAGILSKYFRDRQLWQFFVAGGMFFLAFALFVDATQLISDNWIGVAILWIFASAFLAVFLRDHRHWWALIPAGLFVTLGTIVALDAIRLTHHDISGSVFFFGLAGTFGVLYLLPNQGKRLVWAAWPGLACLSLALLILGDELFRDFWGYLFPALLIVLGGMLVSRSIRGKHGHNNNPSLSHLQA